MGRTKTVVLGLAAWAVCGSPLSALPLMVPQPAQAAARAGNQLYQLRLEERGYAITIKEVGQGAAFSIIQIETTGLLPSFTTGAVAIFKAVYDIARARGFEYAVAINLPGAPRTPNDGQRIAVKVFMTKDRRTSLQELLGPEYSPEAQRRFDREGWMSVTQLRAMFEGRRGVVTDPLADLIGDYSLQPDGEPIYRVSKDTQGYVIAARTIDGWSTPLPLASITEAERSQAAAGGMRMSAGLRTTKGSADQGFDVLRVEEPVPGSPGSTVVLYVMFTWFGPDLIYKRP
jgi:hypothetical protein